MEDRLEPIEGFIEELKKESLKNRTPMTSNDEIDLRDTLITEYKNIKDANVSIIDYVKVLNTKLHATGQSFFTKNGINLIGIKQIVQETSKNIKEQNANETINSNTNFETEYVKDNNDSSRTNEEMEQKEAIQEFVDNTFSNMSNSQKERMAERISNVQDTKDEFTKKVEEAREAGTAEPTKEDFFQMHKQKFGLVDDEILLADISWNTLNSLENSGCTTPMEMVTYMENDIVFPIVFDGEYETFKKIVYERPEITIEEFVEQIEIPRDELTPPEHKIDKKNMTPSKFFAEVVVAPNVKRAMRSCQNKLENCSRKIENFPTTSIDSKELVKLLMEKERCQYELNLQKTSLAGIYPEREPVISEDLKKQIILAYINGDSNLAALHKEFLRNGTISEDMQISVLDFIDVVSDELEKRGFTKEEIKAFSKKEKDILQKVREVDALETIETNLEKRTTAHDERNTNALMLNTARNDVIFYTKYTSTIKNNLKNRIIESGDMEMFYQASEPHRDITSTSENKGTQPQMENQASAYFGLQLEHININKTLNRTEIGALLEKKQIAITDVEEERKGLIPFIKKIRNKLVGDKSSSDIATQNKRKIADTSEERQ